MIFINVSNKTLYQNLLFRIPKSNFYSNYVHSLFQYLINLKFKFMNHYLTQKSLNFFIHFIHRFFIINLILWINVDFKFHFVILKYWFPISNLLHYCKT